MKDYNFFEIYESKKGMQINPKSAYFVGALILLICVGLSVGLVARNLILSYQINDMAQKLADIKVSTKYIQANKLRVSIDSMTEYDKSAEIALEKFYSNQIIGTSLLEKISSALPSTISMVSFKMNNTLADISFQVPTRKAGAELILSLKNTGLFKDVALISVFGTQDGTGFMVYTACIMEEGEIK